MVLTSEPHSPVAMTFTRTSLDDRSVGTGRSSKRNFPGSSRTKAWLRASLLYTPFSFVMGC